MQSALSAANRGFMLYSQTPHQKSQGENCLLRPGGVQLPDGSHWDHQNPNVGDRVRDGLSQKVIAVVDSTFGRDALVPIPLQGNALEANNEDLFRGLLLDQQGKQKSGNSLLFVGRSLSYPYTS